MKPIVKHFISLYLPQLFRMTQHFKNIYSSSKAAIYCIGLFVSLFFNSVNAQTYTTSDCLGAFVVCDLTYNQPLSFTGFGNVQDIPNPSLTCFSNGETNSSWYLINVQSPGLLGFNIIPNDPTTDYDWIVYNLSNASCADIGTDGTLRVGCNFSSSTSPSSATGANGGTNPQDGPLIPVAANQTYALLVNNFSSNQNGFLLDLSLSTAQIIDDVPPALRNTIQALNCGANSIPISMTEFVKCFSVTPQNFIISGPTGDIEVGNVSSVNCINAGSFEKDFTLILNEQLQDGGTYTLKMFGNVLDNCDNTLVDTSFATFTVNTFGINFTSSAVNCALNNGSVSITVTGGTGPFETSFIPSNAYVSSGSNTLVVNNLPIGWQYFTVSDFLGCRVTDSVRLSDANNFDLSFIVGSDTCSAGVGSATVSPTGGTPPYNISWINASPINPLIPNIIGPIVTGNYIVAVSDNGGCALIDTVEIPDFRFNLQLDFLFTVDEEFPLFKPVDFINLSSGTSGFFWDFGDGGTSTLTNPSHVFLSSGTFPVSLIGFNEQGCLDTIVKFVTLPFHLGYYAPNAFTPNGDNLNDNFNIIANGIRDTTFELIIFDRWGQTVFKTNDKLKGWNGKKDNSGDKRLPTGQYPFRVYFRDQTGKQHTKYGAVYMIVGKEE